MHDFCPTLNHTMGVAYLPTCTIKIKPNHVGRYAHGSNMEYVGLILSKVCFLFVPDSDCVERVFPPYSSESQIAEKHVNLI